MKWLLIGLVRGYQILLSPLLGPQPTCRYYPSCSAYALQALQVHGAVRGTWLAVRRLLRCHPWSDGGVDHVPPRRGSSEDRTGGSPADSGSGAERATGPAVECDESHSPTLLPASAGGPLTEQGA
ncbi:membrane protein insertion efficiency factor YidD [Nocardioides sp. zg-536]|uniref:Putative membrane protein insertion efficiency factor n=1 Tax=Nocardioides faecalis TaxID=2803858 RepID=A0A938Y650_9ACTN|nr:membrane protein insertion efficiency factor YidD [Nocardioides faecalis]MBM9459937.1 membrane protein insertion efficiency factor YidD [Nocardioides faecalis]QVI58837.1 membrane protein insertion efficiency factor YidD [Nocardioides faecalis]